MLSSFEEPIILSMTLNTYCGLNCSFCFNNVFRKKMHDTTFNEVMNYIKINNNLTTIAISGGEPLLDERLNRIFSMCKEKEIQISIDTNYNVPLGEQSNVILNFGQIRVKLFSTISEKHDRLVGVSGHYQKISQFMSWLDNNFRYSKVLLFPILSSNLNEIEQVAEFAIDRGFYCNFFTFPRGSNRLAALSKKDYIYVMKKVSDIFELYPKRIFLDFPLAGLNDRSLKNICPAIFISSHIDVDGYLRPCKYSSIKIGSLNEYSLHDLWEMQKMEVQRLNSHCLNCNRYSDCGGGCFANKTDRNIDYYCPRTR
ncbi:MAG: radical SAM protein [Minisyncoccia bacterium]